MTNERMKNENEESKDVLTDVEGGEPGPTRESVQRAREATPEQAPGMPRNLSGKPEGAGDNLHAAPAGSKETDPLAGKVQDLGGGAKDEFETARDDREGHQKIGKGLGMGKPSGADYSKAPSPPAYTSQADQAGIARPDPGREEAYSAKAPLDEAANRAKTIPQPPDAAKKPGANVPEGAGELGERSADVMPDVLPEERKSA